MDFLGRIRSLDAYPKTIEDFRIRTLPGAAVSIVSTVIILVLFFSEFSFYLETEVQPELYVDVSRGEKLRINFDILFPHLPCSYVSLDAMDVAGEHQFDVHHNVFKKRLSPEGAPKAVIKEEVLGGEKLNLEPASGECGSCYGAESDTIKCCTTCEEVREAYRQKGWAFGNYMTIAQCVKEGWAKRLEEEKDEGCELYGFLMVNKVAGNFHFAPGKSFQSANYHVHDLQPFNLPGFNLSHKIIRLSFGTEFPGIVNPLDDVTKYTELKNSNFQYNVKIVPTIYKPLAGIVIHTNQFSVTEHFRTIDHGKGAHGLPGVFFMYDLSPIMVQFTEHKRSLAHFLTGVCAIIGGVFTVAGIIDSFIYHSIHTLQKKIELGKAS